MSKANEDVELARAWLLGNSGLFDDLADLVESMIDKPLDPACPDVHLDDRPRCEGSGEGQGSPGIRTPRGADGTAEHRQSHRQRPPSTSTNCGAGAVSAIARSGLMSSRAEIRKRLWIKLK